MASEPKTEWDGEIVRKWLASRFSTSQSEQDRADKRGRKYEDDYNKAAAEEWVCQIMRSSEATNDQKRFGELLKELLDRDEYRRVSDMLFERRHIEPHYIYSRTVSA